MFENQQFQQLVDKNMPTGEVTGVDRFLIIVKGLDSVPSGALVMFDNGNRGMVREVKADRVNILNIDSENIPIGSLVVMVSPSLVTGVGEGLIGRVVSALGDPLDGKGPISFTAQGNIFNPAPGIADRKLLSDQLVTGVGIIDCLFTFVLGQRIAILGDSKSGKSTITSQITESQRGKNRIVIHVLIAKRKVDVDNLLAKLEKTGAIKYSIVVVASIFDSLAQSYLAPYAGAAMGEYLWHQGRDVIMIYDDLSNHARVYREISLLSRTNPGRDSYPGDVFYAHSSLLERAGRLDKNGATMAAIPLVLAPGNDITAYLPTNIMSITDGQIILDMNAFREGIRPAVSAGLSVSRVGGIAQSKPLKKISSTLFRKLSDYRQAAQFAHFGTELSAQSKADYELGKLIYQAFKQGPEEVFTMPEQILMLGTVLKSDGKVRINMDLLKKRARELGSTITSDDQYEPLYEQLLKEYTVAETATTAPAATAPALGSPAPPPQTNQPAPDKKAPATVGEGKK